MKNKKNFDFKSVANVLLPLVLALLVGTIIILCLGENPIVAYQALIEGAFKGKLKLGTTLASFTPLILTTTAFIIAAKAGAFNVGVEGEVLLGGIVAAYIGINWTNECWCGKCTVSSSNSKTATDHETKLA